MPRRQRRRAWGSVTEISRGRKYVIRWVENTPAGRKRKSKTVYGTYREACMELDRLHVEKARDSPVPTIEEAYLKWVVPEVEASVESGTLARGTMDVIFRAWRKYVGPKWGSCPVDSLKPIELQDWMLALSSSMARMSILTLRKIYSSISGFVELPIDPFAANVKYRMPTRKTTERKKGTYTLAQASEIVGKIKGRRIEPGFIMACFGSCRSGESLGVKIHELERHDFDGRVFVSVPILRQMEGNGREPTPDGQLKTPHSVRIVVIPPPYSLRLLEIAEEREAFGTEWLCDGDDGMPINRTMTNREWKSTCEELGIDFLPWSNLRQSWRTIMGVELGMPWDMLEMMMGHALPGVSGRHYIKPSREQIVRSFAGAFPGDLG